MKEVKTPKRPLIYYYAVSYTHLDVYKRQGLGTVWAHREREIFDSEKGKALLREWKLPETLRGVGAIALGYPAQEAGQPAARKQNYIVRI